jgi:CYTH domain-containing protein
LAGTPDLGVSGPPKYALLENERRFRVNPATAPDLAGLAFRRIEDRYVDGTRLRLRAMTDSVTGARELKFCKKYGGDDPASAPIVNIYLTEAEHAALAVLPGRTITKRRYRLAHGGRGFGVDVFEGELAGLVLCEAEADSRAAVMALTFPPWAGGEVTDDPFFTGGNLCTLSAADLAARLR